MQETHRITHSATHLKACAVTFRHIAGTSPHLRARPRAVPVKPRAGGDGEAAGSTTNARQQRNKKRPESLRFGPFSVAGEGFEPTKSMTADLQSAPFGRSGNPPGADGTIATVVAS